MAIDKQSPICCIINKIILHTLEGHHILQNFNSSYAFFIVVFTLTHVCGVYIFNFVWFSTHLKMPITFHISEVIWMRVVILSAGLEVVINTSNPVDFIYKLTGLFTSANLSVVASGVSNGTTWISLWAMGKGLLSNI